MKPAMDTAQFVIREIRNFTASSPANALGGCFNEKAWGTPLVGFSGGEDSLYETFKSHIGSFHFTPREIFSLAFPESKVEATELSVISYVLPQTEESKADNAGQQEFPAERWARSRVYGEAFNIELSRHLESALSREGFQAVAPSCSPYWAMETSAKHLFASRWSERHAAYASGLGTFGVCDGLITAVGKAVRLGSVVARLRVPPTVRQYDSYQAYCLKSAHGSCEVCLRRCPAGAISDKGHDKLACFKYLKKTETFVQNTFGFEGYGCGLCQTAVPCASGIPSPIMKRANARRS